MNWFDRQDIIIAMKRLEKSINHGMIEGIILGVVINNIILLVMVLIYSILMGGRTVDC
jgi:hypothetical protein